MSYGRLYRGPVLLLLFITVLPLLARGQYSYLLPLAQLCGIYAIIVTGLTLLMGFTGQVSLGHAGFYALGAYVAGVAVSTFNAPLWIAIPAAVVAGGLLALISGFWILRLKGHYLALATLCIGVIVVEAINRMEITGAAEGLFGMPEISFFGLLPGNPLAKVYFIWGIVLLVVLWAIHLTESPAGRALKAVHGDEDAAESLGVSAFSVKLKVFIASGVLAAIAGVLYTFVSTDYLSPEEFSLMRSVMLVTMVAIGGMGSVWGGIAGSVTLLGLREVITLVSERFGSTDATRYIDLTFGIMLVVIMIFSRDGLLPGIKRGFGRLTARRHKRD
jgi:branched-chain amino acid transport system permease protein